MSEKTIGVIFLSSVLLPANKNNQELLEKNDLNLEQLLNIAHSQPDEHFYKVMFLSAENLTDEQKTKLKEKNILFSNYQDINLSLEQSKIALLYKLLHETSSLNFNDKIIFEYKDIDPVVIEILKSVYSAYPNLIPKNVQLNLRCLTDMDGVAIQGTGKIDFDYEQNLQTLLKNHLYVFNQLKPSEILGKIKEANINFFKPRCLTYPISPAELSEDNNAVLDYKQNGWFLAEPNELINGITWGDELSDFERNLFTLNKQGVLSALQNLVGEYKENDPVKLKNDFATQDIDEKVRKFYQENIKRSFFSDNDELNAIFSKYHCQTYSYFLNNFFTHAFEPLQGAVSHNDDIIANLSIVNKELFSEVKLPAVIFKDLVSQEGKDSFQLPGEVLALFSFSEKGIRLIGLKTSTSLLQDFIKGKNIDIKNKELRNQAAFQHLLYKLTKATNITDFTESKEEYIKHFGYVKYFPKFFDGVIKIYSVNNQEEKETTFKLSEQVELAERIIKDEPHNSYEDVCDAYKFLIVNLQAELAEAYLNYTQDSTHKNLEVLGVCLQILMALVVNAKKYSFLNTGTIDKKILSLCQLNEKLAKQIESTFNSSPSLPDASNEILSKTVRLNNKFKEISDYDNNYLANISSDVKNLWLDDKGFGTEKIKSKLFGLAKINGVRGIDDFSNKEENQQFVKQYFIAIQNYQVSFLSTLEINAAKASLHWAECQLMTNFFAWLQNKKSENKPKRLYFNQEDFKAIRDEINLFVSDVSNNVLNFSPSQLEKLDVGANLKQGVSSNFVGEYNRVSGANYGLIIDGHPVEPHDIATSNSLFDCLKIKDQNLKLLFSYLFGAELLPDIASKIINRIFITNNGQIILPTVADKKFLINYNSEGRSDIQLCSVYKNGQQYQILHYFGCMSDNAGEILGNQTEIYLNVKLSVNFSDIKNITIEPMFDFAINDATSKISYIFREKSPNLTKNDSNQIDFFASYLSDFSSVLHISENGKELLDNTDLQNENLNSFNSIKLSLLGLFNFIEGQPDKLTQSVEAILRDIYNKKSRDLTDWIRTANEIITFSERSLLSPVISNDERQRLENLAVIGYKVIADVKKFDSVEEIEAENSQAKKEKLVIVNDYMKLLSYTFTDIKFSNSMSEINISSDRFLKQFDSFIRFVYLNKIQLKKEWMAIFSVYEKHFHSFANDFQYDASAKPLIDKIHKIFGASKEQKPGLYQALITTQLETGLVSLIDALEYTHNLRPNMLGFAIDLPAQNDNLVTLIKGMKQEDTNKSKAQINFERILATAANKMSESQDYTEKHGNKHQYTVLRENILKNENITSRLSSLEIASLVKDDITSSLAVLKGSFWGWLFNDDIVDTLSSAALKQIILKQPYEEILNAVFKPRKTFFGLINYLTVANNLRDEDLFAVALTAKIQPHLLSDSKQLNRLWNYIQQDESRIDNLFKEHFQLFNTLAETFRVNFVSGPWTKYSELWSLFNSQVLNPGTELETETVNLLQVLDKQQNLDQTTKSKLNEIDAAFKFRVVHVLDEESSEQERDTNQSKSTIAIPHTPGGSRKPDVESKDAENTDKHEEVQSENKKNIVQMPTFETPTYNNRFTATV